MNLRAANIPEGKPPPKNMLKRSSGVMSASKPRWKSKPPPCEWAGLLGSSPPVKSYCRLLSELLSTAYALPISRGGKGHGINSESVITVLYNTSRPMYVFWLDDSHCIPHSATKWKHKHTFKGLCCPRGMIFVWMELECKLPVGFLEVVFICFFVDTKDFIIVFAPFYPERVKHRWTSAEH